MGKLKLGLIAIAAALALALGAFGCGEDDEGAAADGTAETEVTTEEPPITPAGEAENGDAAKDKAKPDRDSAEPKGAAIELGDSQFGPVLFDETGQAIYLFDKEATGESQCYGECAAEWPPVLTEGEPEAGPGLSEGKLGTTDRRDGTTQVTYNGHPLYLYAHEGPGEVRCHNVPGFGGIWLALNAAGDSA